MELFNAVLNFIFPQTCGICEKICEDAICNSCKKKLEKITFPHRKCFLEITGIYYDEHMHIFKYEGIIKEKLRQYKFKDQAYLCEFFAEIIYSNKKIMKYINNYDYIIQKQRNIKPQSSMNKLERKNNIKNAYTITNKLEIKNKKILLFDDVFTTGSTTNECSRMLKENGAKKIGVLTIAKD